MRLKTTAAAMPISPNTITQMRSAIFPIMVNLDQRKNKIVSTIEELKIYDICESSNMYFRREIILLNAIF
jgi:hypothetical protein